MLGTLGAQVSDLSLDFPLCPLPQAPSSASCLASGVCFMYQSTELYQKGKKFEEVLCCPALGAAPPLILRMEGPGSSNPAPCLPSRERFSKMTCELSILQSLWGLTTFGGPPKTLRTQGGVLGGIGHLLPPALLVWMKYHGDVGDKQALGLSSCNWFANTRYQQEPWALIR